MSRLNYIITSDPQYPWTANTDDGIAESDDVRNTTSQALISAQYNSINAYVSSKGASARVLINGDLTAFGHGWQRSKMDELLKILNSPYCYGLGNHDIENNYMDTANNGAATDTMRAFLDHYNSLSLTGKSWGVTISNPSHYVGSFNYSWDDGDFRFIQLNNFPGMTDYNYNKTIASVDPRKIYMRWDSNLKWLNNRLATAYLTGKKVFINVHKPNGWPAEALTAMKALFLEYKSIIKAIFSGHHHKNHGYRQDYTRYMGGHIPVFLSGSASQRTYLIVETDPFELNIGIYLVKNNDWVSRELIYNIPLKDKLENVLIKPVIDLGKAMTINKNISCQLQGAFGFPEQNLTLTRDSAKSKYFSIHGADSSKRLVWNKDKNPSLYFHNEFYNGNNLWEILLNHSDNSYVIKSAIDNYKVIDCPNNITDSRTNLVVNDLFNVRRQRFVMSEISADGLVYIVSALDSGKVLASQSENSAVILYDKDKGSREVFQLLRCEDKGDNVFQIVNLWTGFIIAWNVSAGAEIFFHKNEYKDEHYWIFEPNKDGTFTIANYKNTGYVLDVDQASTANRTIIKVHTRNGNAAQRFSLLKNDYELNAPPIADNRAFVLEPKAFQSSGHFVLKVAAQNSALTVAYFNTNNYLERFKFVRAKDKGHSVYQIVSNAWPSAVMSLHNGKIYLTENNYNNSQFWHLHVVSWLKPFNYAIYMVANYESPNQIISAYSDSLRAYLNRTLFQTIMPQAKCNMAS